MGPVPQSNPSVPIDPILDDNQAEFLACQEWSQSDEGQLAKIQNPQGYANVQAHALAHKMAAAPPPPPAPPGPGGGGPPAEPHPPAPPQDGGQGASHA